MPGLCPGMRRSMIACRHVFSAPDNRRDDVIRRTYIDIFFEAETRTCANPIHDARVRAKQVTHPNTCLRRKDRALCTILRDILVLQRLGIRKGVVLVESERRKFTSASAYITGQHHGQHPLIDRVIPASNLIFVKRWREWEQRKRKHTPCS